MKGKGPKRKVRSGTGPCYFCNRKFFRSWEEYGLHLIRNHTMELDKLAGYGGFKGAVITTARWCGQIVFNADFGQHLKNNGGLEQHMLEAILKGGG